MQKLIFILIFIIPCLQLQAQEKTNKEQRLTHYVHAGINIGALAPIGIPNTIRKIESYSPMFNPSIGYEVSYRIDEKWAVGSGIKFEYKGMKIKDSVIYFHTLVTMESGGQTSEFEGDFSGHNSTTAHNAYLTIPVHTIFTPGKYWHYRLGVYFAFLLDARFDGTVTNGYIRKGNSLGEKVTIQEASFDFKEVEKTFDFGFQAGAGRSIGKKFGIDGTLSWGVIPIFPSSFQGMSFPMYNIFFNLGASYRLF